MGSFCGEGARGTVEKQMVENQHLLRNGAGRITRAAAEAFMIAAKSYNGDLEGFARYMEEISKILNNPYNRLCSGIYNEKSRSCAVGADAITSNGALINKLEHHR